METIDIRFLRDELVALKGRLTALENFVRGEKGDACPECSQEAFFAVGKTRTKPGGYGAIGKDKSIFRCAVCGHEEVR